MLPRRRELTPLADRGPLRVMFVITSMPVGGAETLLVELVRRMDRGRFLPELCCLKRFDPLGEVLAEEIPAFTGLLAHKYDFRVLWRLTRLLRQRRIDAVVTVGTGGDKMFWGRLAGWLAGVPVICSALHSTGLPDHVEFSNRLLAPLTDAFIAVAEPHALHLAAHEGCPAEKIHVIPNGVDVERFHPRWPNPALHRQWHLDAEAPAVGIVAALRPEKNHEMFLYVAALVHRKLPAAQFLIVGDGPQRTKLQALAQSLGIAPSVRFLGTRADVPEVLALSGRRAVDLAQRGQPGLSVGSDGEREAGGGHPRRFRQRDRARRADRLPRRARRLASRWPTACWNCWPTAPGPPPWAAPAAKPSSPIGPSTAWCKATRTSSRGSTRRSARGRE